MKISDGIKLGIGLCIGKALSGYVEKKLWVSVGILQDKYYTDEQIKKAKSTGGYAGTKYKNVTNKKNPIGFV